RLEPPCVGSYGNDLAEQRSSTVNAVPRDSQMALADFTASIATGRRFPDGPVGGQGRRVLRRHACSGVDWASPRIVRGRLASRLPRSGRKVTTSGRAFAESPENRSK